MYIARFDFNAQCSKLADKLKQTGMPPCNPRSTFRTYFRNLRASDPEGWLEKAMKFTGESEPTIVGELRSRRTKKKRADIKRSQEPRQEPVKSALPIKDIIDTMTTADEAVDFVRSSPSISEQFLTYVVSERKKNPPKR
mgnify:CR=1 FL=1